MKILSIETATPASSVAVGEDGDVLAMSANVNSRGHVGFLMPAIDFCFAQVGWTPSDIELVAVDVGPGPYTGLRAGIAAAQGIAAAVGAPIVTASSLTILALRAATGHRTIWPIVDVRRGEVATAPYRPVPGGVIRDGETELVSHQDFAGLIDADPSEALVVGEWHALPEDVLRGLTGVRKGRPRYPAADVLLEIAALQAQRGETMHSDQISPLYLREPDARINWSDFRDEGVWPGAPS